MSSVNDPVEQRLQAIEQELQSLRNGSSIGKFQTNDDVLNIASAAAVVNLTIGTIYFKTHKKEIPFWKDRNRVRFSRKQLLEWDQERNKSRA